MICLLEPTASVLGLSTYAAHNILEPLGLQYLAAFLASKGHPCSVVQQRCESRATVLARLVGLRPRILGITAETYNIDDALWFAASAKRELPNVVVVLGGYHVTALPQVACEDAVDYVVLGEGEAVFLSLVKAILLGEDASGIPGIALMHEGRFRCNPRARRIEQLDDLPFPDRNPSVMEQCRMHGLMYPPPEKQKRVASVLALRGCPYSCAFCSSQTIWNHELRFRSPQNVADELEQLANEYAVDAVFFCDLTFNADKRYTMALCEEIARRDTPIHFYAMCNLKGMDSEVAAAMAAAKCSKIGFGVESFTDLVRANMKASGGMDVEHANAVLDQVCSAGMLAKCYFIIGFPWETEKTLACLREDILLLRTDEIKVTFYTPFPGTRGYELHKDLLITKDWSRFTTLTEPLVQNNHVTVDRFKEVRKAIFHDFYNSKNWWQRVKTRVSMFPKYRESFGSLVTFLEQQHILEPNAGHGEWGFVEQP